MNKPKTSCELTGKRCQCRGCGEVFSALSNFDKHRVGKFDSARVCLNPESLGMVIRHSPKGSYWVSKPPEGGMEWRNG